MKSNCDIRTRSSHSLGLILIVQIGDPLSAMPCWRTLHVLAQYWLSSLSLVLGWDAKDRGGGRGAESAPPPPPLCALRPNPSLFAGEGCGKCPPHSSPTLCLASQPQPVRWGGVRKVPPLPHSVPCVPTPVCSLAGSPTLPLTQERKCPMR